MDGTGPQHPLTPRLADDLARSGQDDSQLDRELESALGVDPSPEFLARVRTRVAAEPEAEPWRLAIRRWSFEPIAGVAVAGIVLAVVVPNLMRSAKRSGPDVAVARHVDGPIRQAVELPLVAREQVAVPAVRRVATRPVEGNVGLSRESGAVHTVPLRLSQPLFSEDERRAFMHFVDAFEEGRLPPVVTTAAAAEPDARTDRRLEPLVIDPLPALARVQQPGEGQW